MTLRAAARIASSKSVRVAISPGPDRPRVTPRWRRRRQTTGPADRPRWHRSGTARASSTGSGSRRPRYRPPPRRRPWQSSRFRQAVRDQPPVAHPAPGASTSHAAATTAAPGSGWRRSHTRPASPPRRQPSGSEEGPMVPVTHSPIDTTLARMSARLALNCGFNTSLAWAASRWASAIVNPSRIRPTKVAAALRLLTFRSLIARTCFSGRHISVARADTETPTATRHDRVAAVVVRRIRQRHRLSDHIGSASK